MWRAEEIVDIAAEGLRAHAARLDLEQAVHGLDALSEVEFHPLLAGAFRESGMGVFPEWPYPGEVSRRAKHAERERCDLVLTRGPGELVDPVAILKERDAAEGTLFAGISGTGERGTAHLWHPEDAFWLEVKVVGQFCFTSGVPGPNRTYSSELGRLPAGDLAKLAREARVAHGALMVIAFTGDRETADHDVGVFIHRCLDRQLPVRTPSTARFLIADRIGNAHCSVVAVPIVRGGLE